MVLFFLAVGFNPPHRRDSASGFVSASLVRIQIVERYADSPLNRPSQRYFFPRPVPAKSGATITQRTINLTSLFFLYVSLILVHLLYLFQALISFLVGGVGPGQQVSPGLSWVPQLVIFSPSACLCDESAAPGNAAEFYMRKSFSNHYPNQTHA